MTDPPPTDAEIIARGKDRLGMIRSRTNDQLIEDGIVIGGNPDTVCRSIEKWAKVGVDEMLLMMQLLPNATDIRSTFPTVVYQAMTAPSDSRVSSRR